MYQFAKGLTRTQPLLGEYDTLALFSSVLLIEDEPAHAALISRALKGVVGEVRHAATGEEGLEYLVSEMTELVFCDLNLPDTSGLDLIAEIRSLRPRLPIIVLTSSTSLDDAVEAMRKGAWDFMLKQLSGDLRGQMQLLVQRTAERKLQQMRELEVRAERDAFWAAAYTAKDGLAILAESGNVVFANAAFTNVARVYGNTQEAGKPQNVVDMIALQDFRVARELQAEIKNSTSDSVWTSELAVSRMHGEEERTIHFQLSLSAVSPGSMPQPRKLAEISDELRYRVLWVHDITDRKERERFQRDLLSTTTHDLKGPLNAILTSAELLTEFGGRDPKQDEEFITRMASCARNAINIIDELLSARRIQDGVLVVRPRWYSAREFLEDVFFDYLPMARSKGIEFTSRPIAEDFLFYADRMALSRVMGNLLSNAIKFTSPGGKVKIFASKGEGVTRIAVSDTGPGIEASALHKLFERYSRLEKHSDVEGSGLGLFVSKNIIEAHNGRIEVRSTVGVGTTFIATLPDGPNSEPENPPH